MYPTKRALLGLTSILCLAFAPGCGEEPPPECEPAPDPSYECGVHPDSCGGELDYGSCEAGFECEVATCLPSDIGERLRLVPGLEVEEVPAEVAGTRAFSLTLTQPEAHGEAEGPTFGQRLLLVHRDRNAPMVLQTIGYGLGIFGRDPEELTAYLAEPTTLLDANQLIVEHRFFGPSIPDEPRWPMLNIYQSAADSHRIVETFSDVYRGPWIGTGASKGGMTALFHHRFFPDDLAGVVPYVAPISFGTDERYPEFLETIGPADGVCRERVKDMGLEVIERRTEIAEYLRQTLPEANDVDAPVLEALVTLPTMTFHIGFWQFWGSVEACEALPPRGGPVERLVAFVLTDPGSLFDPYAYDPAIGPYTYQTQNELGSMAYDYTHLYDAMRQVDYSVLPQTQPELPWGGEPRFDPLAMPDVDRFLREEAERVLALYGEWDPWTAGMITLDTSKDNVLVLGPEMNHGASLSALPADLREPALDRLYEWAAQDPAARKPALGVDLGAHLEMVRSALRADQRVALQRLRAELTGNR